MKELSLPARLEELSKSGQIPLHMPGHKRNEALAEYLHTLGARLDITEITGFDDLHDAQGILRAAQDRAAALWGVRKSWFLINGSTGGILAGIRALAPAGSRVLVMDQGRTVQCGTPEELLTHPATPFVRQLIGQISPNPE